MSLNIEQCRLGVIAEPFALETSDEHRAAALRLVEQASRSLYVFSFDLDKRVYDHAPLMDAITKFALRNHRCKIQILVRDTHALMQDGHRIIETQRRLSERIEMRKLNSDYPNRSDSFLIADETAVLYQPIATRYTGTLECNARRQARELVNFFNDAWLHSAPESKLKRWHI